MATRKRMCNSMESANTEEQACAARVADAKAKLTGLSSSFSGNSSTLKQQYRDDVKAGESALKRIADEKRELQRDLAVNLGALENVRNLLTQIDGSKGHAHPPPGEAPSTRPHAHRPVHASDTDRQPTAAVHTRAGDTHRQPTAAVHKLREILASLEPEVAEGKHTARAAVTTARNQESSLEKQIATNNAKLKDLGGRVGSAAQKSKDQLRQDIAALEVRRKHAIEDVVAAELQSREADGVAHQHRELFDLSLAQPSSGAVNDLRQHVADETTIREEMIRIDNALVDECRRIEDDLADVRRREVDLIAEVAELSVSSASITGPAGSANGRLKKQFQDQLKALEATLKQVQTQNDETKKSLHFCRGKQRMMKKVQERLDMKHGHHESEPQSHSATFDEQPQSENLASRPQASSLTTLRSSHSEASTPQPIANVPELTTLRSAQTDTPSVVTPQPAVDITALADAQRDVIAQSVAPIAAQVGDVRARLDQLAQSTSSAPQPSGAEIPEGVLAKELRSVREELSKLQASRQGPPTRDASAFDAAADAAYRSEAAMTIRAAEHEARSLRAAADLEAKMLRDTADREAKMTREMAEREKHNLVDAAKRESEDLIEKSRRRAERLTEDAEDRLNRMKIEEDAQATKLKQMHKEQAEVQAALMTSRVQLDKDKENLLVEERDRLQVHTSISFRLFTRTP